MRLTAFALLGLVGSCSVLAAPAPPQKAWVTGWKEVDPDGDCKFVRKRETLTIEIPGKEHNYLENAPLLLREVEGNFVVQVHVRSGGFLPGLGKVRFASAGLVLVVNENTWVMLKKDWARNREEPNDSNAKCFVAVKMVGKDGQIEIGNWRGGRDFTDPPSQRDEIFLRLERQGNDLYPVVSEDGKTWQEMDKVTWTLPKTVKLGVLATNLLGQPFKPRFDKFKLTLQVKKDH